MRGLRALKIAVVVMGILIVVGTATLIFLIVKKLTAPSQSARPNKEMTVLAPLPEILLQKTGHSGRIILPPDSKLLGTALSGHILMLTLKVPHGQEILLFNLHKDKPEATISVQQGSARSVG